MGIALILWMSLHGGRVAAGAGQLTCDDTGCNTIYFPRSYCAKPLEHVIEIRTKRERKEIKCTPAQSNITICDGCPEGFGWDYGDMFRDYCVRVTREVWIDGRRWGVLQEIEESPAKGKP
jgi:hypothetical protein